METHTWLRVLSEIVGSADARRLLEKIRGLSGKHHRDMADSVLRVMLEANSGIAEEWKGDAEMFEALMEIMEPQIQMREERFFVSEGEFEVRDVVILTEELLN